MIFFFQCQGSNTGSCTYEASILPLTYTPSPCGTFHCTFRNIFISKFFILTDNSIVLFLNFFSLTLFSSIDFILTYQSGYLIFGTFLFLFPLSGKHSPKANQLSVIELYMLLSFKRLQP